MKSLQEPDAAARDGEWWALMEPIFHMDQQEPAIVRFAQPALRS